jgi:GR25 family glycosyltransferase involved in LPS biosynthesis
VFNSGAPSTMKIFTSTPKSAMEKKSNLNCKTLAPLNKKNCSRTLEDCSYIHVKLNRETLLRGLTEMCSVNGRPFSAIDDSGFRVFFDRILEALPGNVKICAKSMPSLIAAEAAKTRDEITYNFKDDMFSIKIDAVTRLDRGYLGVNLQKVVDCKIIIRCIGCIELTQSHTADYLKDKIINLLEEFKLDLRQAYSITYDNGTNMVRAGKILDQQAMDLIFEGMTHEKIMDEIDPFESGTERVLREVMELMSSFFVMFSDVTMGINEIRCVAHTLQLAVEGSIKELCEKNGDPQKIVLFKVREFMKKARTPKVQHMIDTYNKNNDVELKAPVLDVSTRWCSTLDMLVSCLSYKPFCSSAQYVFEDDVMLTDSEYEILQTIVDVLEHAKIATVKLQAEQLTLSDMFIIWKECCANVARCDTPYSKILQNHLKEREKSFETNQPLVAALYLDPRVQCLMSKTQVETAKAHIIVLAAKVYIIKNSGKHAPLETNDPSQDIHDVDDEEDLDAFEIQLREAEKERQKEILQNRAAVPQGYDSAQVEKEVNNFFNVPRISRNESIMRYWIANKKVYPALYDAAMVVLGAPPTQVSVERLFSGLKFIIHPLRNKMNSETVNNIMLVRTNELHKRKDRNSSC